MAMSPSGGGGPRNSLSEINVTPLVDVMLVLLVVFMVTTPVIIDELKPRKVEVNLPNVEAEPLTSQDLSVPILSLHKELKVSLKMSDSPESSDLVVCAKGQPFEACLAPLEEKLKNNRFIKEAEQVLIEADRQLPYGFVVDVMNRVRQAGITRLGMVTNPPGAEEPTEP